MKKIFYGTILLLLITVIQLLPCFNVVANAAERNNDLDIITDVRITDINGNALGSNIDKDESMRLYYEFELANGTAGVAGDTFTMALPDEILAGAVPDADLMFSSTEKAATASLDVPTRTIILTFEQIAFDYSDVSGSFWFQLAFDETNIGENEPVEIDFDIGQGLDPKTITIDFLQPPPPEADIEKSGVYDPVTNKITWTLTVNSDNATVDSMVITDTISTGHEFDDAVSTTTVPAAAASYTYDVAGPRVFEYTFLEQITTEQVITYTTTVNNDDLVSATSRTIDIVNSADLLADGTPSTSPNEIVTIPIDLIDKTASYDSDNNEIDWTITVNTNGLTIPDVVITDTIQDDLIITNLTTTLVDSAATLVEDVAPLDTNEFSLVGRLLTINLGTISEEHIIQYSTPLDSSVLYTQESEAFNNTATLSSPLVTNNNTSRVNIVPPGSTIINKTSVGYDASTGIISWQIVVNPNVLTLDDVVISDTIPSGQEYVANSFAITGGLSTIAPALVTTASSIVYTFPIQITQTYTITFETQMTDTDQYLSNYSGTATNTATVALSNGTGGPSSANQPIVSEVLDKTRGSYNYDTREMEWTIEVNNNEIDLENVVITDTIDADQDFILSSFDVYNNTLGVAYTDGNLNYDVATDSFTYSFLSVLANNLITDMYTITYSTSMVDLTHLESNGTFNLANTSILDHETLTAPISESSSRNVTSEIISKDETYNDDEDFIDWVITLNRNEIAFNDAVITDTLSAGLELDTTSVELWNLDVNSDRSTNQTTEYPIDETNVAYDLDTKLFTFTMPTPISTAFALKFRTYISDQSLEPFTNTADINVTGLPAESDSNSSPILVTFAGSGGSALGNLGRVTVTKADRETSVPLEGAVFELIDKYDIPIERNTTDASGEAIFDRIRFDEEYTIVEVTAPTGYLSNPVNPDGSALTPAEYRFTIPDASAEHSISYTFYNQVIKGNIQLTKNDEDSSPLAGAVFTLYELDDTSTGRTATSDASGLVEFVDVPYGDYYLLETTAPEGYLLNTSRPTATINVDGATVIANPDTLSNTSIRGNINLIKTNEDLDLLEGAVFSLYNDSGSVVATETTGSDGEITFTNIVYGDYTLRETTSPTGYVLSNTVHNVSIVTDGETVQLQSQALTNYPITGSISFTKLNPEGNGVQGAIFTLYNNSGSAVTTATSDALGVVTFSSIPYGNYTISETTPPTGYLPNNTVLTATIGDDDNEQTVSTDPSTITDQHITGSILLTKLDENSSPLANAVFALHDIDGDLVSTVISDADGEVLFNNVHYGQYTIREITAPTGYVLNSSTFTATITTDGAQVLSIPSSATNRRIIASIQLTKYNETGLTPLEGSVFTLYDDAGNVLSAATSDQSGLVTFANVLYGDYTIRETSAPTGYVLSDTIFTAQVEDDDDGKVIYTTPSSISNQLIKGNIQLLKYDDRDNPLGGAIFTLYDSDGNIVSTATSDNNGYVLFTDVTYGDYTVRETSSPSGYLPSLTVFTASITENESLVTTNPSSTNNNRILGNIVLLKLDENGNPLMNAEFSLYLDTDKEFTTPLITKTSDEKGQVLFENIVYGYYRIKETKAPMGYALSEKIISAGIIEDGVTVSTNPKTLENEIIRADISIMMLSLYNQPLASGSEIGLYDEGGNLVEVEKIGRDGFVTFYNIPYGDYSVSLISSPSSDSVSSESYAVSVTSIEDLVLETSINDNLLIKSDATVTRTGDRIIVYVITLFVALILLVLIIVLIANKKRAKITFK